MSAAPVHKEIYAYFRMGIATGIVTREEVVAWADAELLRAAQPTPELIDLSLAGKLPYSQLLHLLYGLQGRRDYDMPLKLLLAHAGLLLEAAPQDATRLVACLRLLLAEEYLSKDIKAQISIFDGDLQLVEQDALEYSDLQQHLAAFLEEYKPYQTLVRQLLPLAGAA